MFREKRGSKMENEKPLEKRTVKELREMALEMEGIVGVSAMKKEELINAIKKVKDIPIKKVREKPVEGIPELKGRIKELKSKMGDTSQINFLRKRISRLKKRTRRLAKRTAKEE